MQNRPRATTVDLVVQTSGSETLVYNLNTNKAYCLNETSANVWRLCDGELTVNEITNEMSLRTKSLIEIDLVWLALEQLNKDGLLEEGFKGNKKFEGLSRREVIRKVSFASVIALPIVSSVVAPQALSAQSGAPVALGQPCTGPLGVQGNCVSGSCEAGRLRPTVGAPQTTVNVCCGSGTIINNAPGSITCITGTAENRFCCSGSISPVPGPNQCAGTQLGNPFICN